MIDNEIIKAGDICTYSYDNDNKSLSIIEIINMLSDKIATVKFRQVIVDDSGNGFFKYLLDSGKTMNVSCKYLHKICLINRQKEKIEWLEKIRERKIDIIDDLKKQLAQAKSEAIKEFVKKWTEEKPMNNICPYICDNKTEYGYCKTTYCINQKYNKKAVTSNYTLPNDELERMKANE